MLLCGIRDYVCGKLRQVGIIYIQDSLFSSNIYFLASLHWSIGGKWDRLRDCSTMKGIPFLVLYIG
jgi:hypothetical protein